MKKSIVSLLVKKTNKGRDFAYYSQVVPASFYRLGTRNEEKGITSYVHTPTFNIDEDALAIGPGLMAWRLLVKKTNKGREITSHPY